MAAVCGGTSCRLSNFSNSARIRNRLNATLHANNKKSIALSQEIVQLRQRDAFQFNARQGAECDCVCVCAGECVCVQESVCLWESVYVCVAIELRCSSSSSGC